MTDENINPNLTIHNSATTMANNDTVRTIGSIANEVQSGLSSQAVQALATLLENGVSPEKLIAVIVEVRRQAKESSSHSRFG